MALGGIVFQRSNRVRLSTSTFQDIWTTENQLQTFVVSENIGGRNRMCRAIIRNPHNINEDVYFMMQRVRVLDRSGIVLFLGRVGQLVPDFASGTLVITCADYLADLSDVTVEAAEYAGIYTGMSTKYLVDQIVYNETHRNESVTHPGNSSIAIPTNLDYSTMDRAFIGGVQVDPTIYQQKISRKYANRGPFYDGDGSTTDPFKYDYRGVKTGFEAIHELAASDSQQDLMVMSLASEAYVNPETDDEVLPQKAFWREWTASAQDGTENFIPLFANNASQYLFIGSNSKFDGIEYTFRQRGNKIDSPSFNTMYWEYWNGNTWVSFTPVDDDKFSYDANVTKQNYGRSTWDAAVFYAWTKRDLGASPDFYGGTVGSNDPTFIWQEGTGNASGRDRNDTTHAGAFKLEGDFVYGDGLTDTTIGTRHGLVDSTYRYWIRVSTNSVITRGFLATIKPYTRRGFSGDVDGVREYFHNVRAEDPTYLEEIWKYTTPATNNGRDGAGGTWLSLNMTGGNDGSGKRLLWDSSDAAGSVTLLDSIQEDWHFGNDTPISGIELHAIQGSYIQIEAISTGATVSVTTAHAHGLSTNDRIIIDQSDSVPSIDSPLDGLTVTGVTNTKTFTITASSTAAMTGSDVVVITGTTGRVITGIPDYTGAALSWYMHRTDRVQGDPHAASLAYRGWDLVNTTSSSLDNNDYSSVYGSAKTHSQEGLTYSYWTLDKGAEGSTPHWYTSVHFNMHFNHSGLTNITNGPGGVSGQTYYDMRGVTANHSAGTASQSGTTVTGSGTTFTSDMVGSVFTFDGGGGGGSITAFASTTSVTVSNSATVSSGSYNIYTTIKTKLARSTLAAAITHTSVREDVATISHFEYPDFMGFAVDDKILIDNEVLLITAINDNVFDCDRGQDGTTGATHALGATVYRLNHDLKNGDRILIERSNTSNLIDTGSQSTPITKVNDFEFTIVPPNGDVSSIGSPVTGRVVTGGTSLNSEFENNNFHSTTPYDDRVSAYVGAATSPSDDADFSIGKHTILGESPPISGVARVAVASTTLSDGIDDSVTTVPVVSPEIGLADLDTVDPNLLITISRDILVGSEQMRVTAVTGTDLTVVRAQNSTSAATHDEDDVVSYYRTRFTTTAAHLLKVGDEAHITTFTGIPNLDGIYTIVAVPSGTTFDVVDQGYDGSFASGTANCTAFSPPPNGKSLFWTKVHMTGTPKTKANVVAIRTAGNQAHLKYFARGKEPWASNILYSSDGSAATRNLDYVYTYDEDAGTGPHLLNGSVGQAIETRLASDIDNSVTAIPLSSVVPYPTAYALIPATGTSIEIYDPKAGTREIMQVTAKPSSNTLTVIRGRDGTTAVAHEADDSIVSLYINGTNQITRYASANTFQIRSISQSRLVSSIATIVIVVGLPYDIEGRYVTQSFPLQSGDSVTLSGIDATSETGVGTDLNDTYVISNVEVSAGSGTGSFSIEHDEATTRRGTAGLVTVPAVDLYTSTSPTLGTTSNNDGDAVYFGSRHPFTQLRIDMKSKPVNVQSDRYTVQWEYFTSNGTGGAYDWVSLTNYGLFDGTNSFNSTGIREVHWSMPTDWRPCQPTVINPTGRFTADKDGTVPVHQGAGWLYPQSEAMFDWRGDWGAGKTAFYVRARIVARPSLSGNGPIISQVWCGPNHWNPVSMDVETLGLNEGESHADPLKFGLTLHQTDHGSDHVEQIISHSVGDNPFEFVNKVVVRGAEGAYGVAKDENSIRKYGITKEKVVNSSSIVNSVQAEQLAVKLLHQLKPSSDNLTLDISSTTVASSIRECHISTRYWPISYHLGKPRPLRAGDLVNVVIYDRNIVNERWMVSQIEYDALEGDVDMILHRDLDRIAEVGPASQRAIRDLMGKTRELARATFTTMDTTVESGIDFMPEGPSRTVARMAYEPIGTYSDVTLDGTTEKVDNDNYRWNLKLYDDYNSNSANRVQLRIDHKGARPDLTTAAEYTTDGAGLGLIARTQYSSTNVTGKDVNKSPIDNSDNRPTTDHQSFHSTVRDHFYPQAGEGTLYLRNSATRKVGSGLYLAHRGIWNDSTYGGDVSTLAADGSTFPIQLHHEVFVGVSGMIVFDDDDNATKEVHNILPDLIDKPMVFLQIVETISEANNPSPTAGFQKLTASVRSWQTNGDSGADIRYRGFNISLYKAGPDGSDGLVDSDAADVPVMYLVVFNSSRDQRYSADHIA